ncbi:MAG: ATPase [Bacteroidales bacterium]|nr:ATPase [Bacteroidales bacterium]
MILIADSGSTKTHWCLVGEEGQQELFTEGLNPRLTDPTVMLSTFQQVRDSFGVPALLYFYGAGCGTEEMQTLICRLLSDAFPNAECHCEGDLLGACRAVCGDGSGMVGILGTGSNLCYYDGVRIALQRRSTGYILGDEGSGNHIGKRLLKDYLEGRMPKVVSDMFHDTYMLSADQLLDRLYRQPYPNRFLASLAAFAAQHQDEEYVAAVLDECFGAFFNLMDFFCGYRHTPLNLAGGLVKSFIFSLQGSAERCHVTLGTLLSDPMEGLIRYHSTHL